MRHTCARSLALSMPAQVQLGHVSGSCCCQALVARHQRKAQSQETASRCACRRSDAGKTLTRAWASRGERKTGKLRENSKVMANRNPVMTNRKKGHDNLENPPSLFEALPGNDSLGLACAQTATLCTQVVGQPALGHERCATAHRHHHPVLSACACRSDVTVTSSSYPPFVSLRGILIHSNRTPVPYKPTVLWTRYYKPTLPSPGVARVPVRLCKLSEPL